MAILNETAIDQFPLFVFGPQAGKEASNSSLTSYFLLPVALLLLASWRRTKGSVQNYPDGPWGLPVIGHLPFLGERPFEKFAEWRQTYGAVFRIRMGSRFTVVINGYKAAHQALVTQAEDFAGRPDFHSSTFISEGLSMLFGTYSALWKQQRAVVRKALNVFGVERRAETEERMTEEADRLIEELTEAPQPAALDDPVHIAAASVIYSLCYDEGRNVRDDSSFLAYLEADKIFSKVMAAGKCAADMLPWTKSLNLQKDFMGQFQRVQQNLTELVRSIQARIKTTWTPGQPRNITDALIDSHVDNILAPSPATERHVTNLAIELTGAGHSTVSIALRWAFLYMADHPELQARVHEELDRVLGSARVPRFADQASLPFCEAVLLETLRFANTQPFLVPHATTRACRLLDFDLPANSLVMVNMESVLRDPEIWEQPDQFDPTRFLDAKGHVDRRKQELVPAFGMGKRRCPGQLIGRMELFLLFARVMQHCRLCKAPGQDYDLKGKCGFSLEPTAYKLNVELR